MKTFLRQLALLLMCALLVGTPLYAASSIYTTKFTNGVIITGGLTTDTLTNTGAVTGADLVATDDVTVGDDLTVTGAATVGETLGVTGAVTLTVPLTAANINNSVRRKVFVVPIGPGGTLADGATYTATIPVSRACTVTGIKAAIGTAIVGGTSTLTISKNGSQTLLSTANIDPTTIAANTATALTLTATGADLALAAGDVVKIVHVAGTQTTDGVGESIAVEVATTDF